MKRWLSRGFWIGLIYLLVFSRVAALQSFVDDSMAGVYLHSAMVLLLVVGLFAYVLRLIHFLFVK